MTKLEEKAQQLRTQLNALVATATAARDKIIAKADERRRAIYADASAKESTINGERRDERERRRNDRDRAKLAAIKLRDEAISAAHGSYKRACAEADAAFTADVAIIDKQHVERLGPFAAAWGAQDREIVADRDNQLVPLVAKLEADTAPLAAELREVEAKLREVASKQIPTEKPVETPAITPASANA